MKLRWQQTDFHHVGACGTSPANPVDGMIWYNTDSDDINVYEGGTWKSIGHAGPCGPPGACGVAGEYAGVGATGFSGVSGPCGPPGPCGPAGAYAAMGACGLQGSCGIQGIQGSCGISGISGISGIVGACGFQGSCGPSGLSGIKGSCGPSGIKGSCGSTGLEGACGLKGGQGTMGACGPSGLQGSCGPTGLQGVQGACGLTGLPAACGPQGVMGTHGGQYSIWKYDPDTDVGDEATDNGTFRLNTAGQYSATKIAIDFNDIYGDSQYSWFLKWDDIDTTYPAYLRITKKDDHSKYVSFRITQLQFHTGVENGEGVDYVEVDVETFGTTDTPFSINDECVISLLPSGDKGSCGPSGLSGVKGSCGPSGLFGSCGPSGIQGVQGSCGPSGLSGIKGSCGPSGITGIKGACGLRGNHAGHFGIWKFDSATADADPGSTFFRLNQSGGFQSDSTALYISTIDVDGSQAAFISSWDDSLTYWGGRIRISKEDDPGTYINFRIGPQSFTSGETTTYYNVELYATGFSSADPFTANDRCIITMIHAGDDGACGQTGLTGVSGIQGPCGPSGIKGPCGLQSACGPSGAMGSCGLPGSQGEWGVTGSCGLQGACGVQGTGGLGGACGVQGACGAKQNSHSLGVWEFSADGSPSAVTAGIFTAMNDSAAYTSNLRTMTKLGINSSDTQGHSIESLIVDWVNNNNMNYLSFTDLTTGVQLLCRVTYMFPAISNNKTFTVEPITAGTAGAIFTDGGDVSIEYFPQSPIVFGDQTIQNEGANSNYLTLETVGACGPLNYPNLAWSDSGNEQGKIYVTTARNMWFNLQDSYGSSQSNPHLFLSGEDKAAKFFYHLQHSYTTLSSSTSVLPFDNEHNVIWWNPSSGTGTHVFSSATCSQENGHYTIVNGHATRAFSINNSISNVQLIGGLTRTISPGGSISFIMNPTGDTAIQVSEVLSSS